MEIVKSRITLKFLDDNSFEHFYTRQDFEKNLTNYDPSTRVKIFSIGEELIYNNVNYKIIDVSVMLNDSAYNIGGGIEYDISNQIELRESSI